MENLSELAPDRPEFAPRPLEFPVIGVGASAGGLQAFELFLRNLDPDFEAAYILVQHLDPNHESMLTELLARHAKLRVSQITDGTEIRPGEVYIIPAASNLVLEDGVLNLIDFEAPRGFRRPIDDFFQSLAIDQGPNAAAVILSGTGGDGTVGIRHVKDAGGLTIVQDPEEAAYDGMPSSALATGLVDFSLPINKMSKAIERFFAARVSQVAATEFDREEFISNVMEEVRRQTGHDFSYYKINTVLRRIQRRMQVLHLTEPTDYVAALREDGTEADALFQDLLINVTSFFRDPEVFDVIRREIVPKLLAQGSKDRAVRVWIPGCSSGEEAYSIAILLAEGLARMRQKPDVQIFATDIDEEMLRRARRAVYPQSAIADLPPELLERYFSATEDGYAVIPAIRDMVRVSAHSVIKDPPFSRIDLISCRNLLIYFDNRLQARVLPLFHYALRPDGWLVLGSAENLSGRDDLFATISRQERVYRKLQKQHTNFVLPLVTRSLEGRPRRADLPNKPNGTSNGRNEREALIHRRVMERYVLPHVVIDEQGNVIHSSTRTSPYLQLSVGAPSMRLLDLAPSELRPALRSVLSAVAERRRRIIRRGIEMSMGDDHVTKIDLVADPLDGVETMIVFRETSRSRTDDDDLEADIGDFRTEEKIKELEDELDETRSTLRTTVEELETSNEELKTSNEEMMSMNEELQSANEELSTVNEELKTKLDELAQLNADQLNFLESTQIATVFVDKEMNVRSFTPVARKLFRFVERDKGRSLLDVRTTVDLDTVREATHRALEGESEIVSQITVDEDTYTFRAFPYTDQNGTIDGAVLVFDDVSQLVKAQGEALSLEQAAASSRREIERLYESAPIGMALVDRERRYRRINESLAEYNGLSEAEHLGKTVTEVLPEIGPRLEPVLSQVFSTGENIARWELVAPSPQDLEREEVFELDVYPLTDDRGRVVQAGIIVHRVTEARRLEADLRHLMAELQHRVKNSLATVMSIVRQTARNAPDRESLTNSLTSRIGALAATHSLLTAADWGAVPARQIVEQEIAPYSRERIEVGGPRIGLGAKAAVTLTLALHELATNAAKYGALSREEGNLSIRWKVDDGKFRLDWQETGLEGIRTPDHAGFGLRFVERTVAHDLDGEVEFDWRESGLVCRIETSLDRVAIGVDHE